jgi:hypothetical protein
VGASAHDNGSLVRTISFLQSESFGDLFLVCLSVTELSSGLFARRRSKSVLVDWR